MEIEKVLRLFSPAVYVYIYIHFACVICAVVSRASAPRAERRTNLLDKHETVFMEGARAG